MIIGSKSFSIDSIKLFNAKLLYFLQEVEHEKSISSKSLETLPI